MLDKALAATIVLVLFFLSLKKKTKGQRHVVVEVKGGKYDGKVGAVVQETPQKYKLRFADGSETAGMVNKSSCFAIGEVKDIGRVVFVTGGKYRDRAGLVIHETEQKYRLLFADGAQMAGMVPKSSCVEAVEVVGGKYDGLVGGIVHETPKKYKLRFADGTEMAGMVDKAKCRSPFSAPSNPNHADGVRRAPSKRRRSKSRLPYIGRARIGGQK